MLSEPRRESDANKCKKRAQFLLPPTSLKVSSPGDKKNHHKRMRSRASGLSSYYGSQGVKSYRSNGSIGYKSRGEGENSRKSINMSPNILMTGRDSSHNKDNSVCVRMTCRHYCSKPLGG